MFFRYQLCRHLQLTYIMTQIDSRQVVIRSFARWAAASATRQGCSMRGRALYGHLDNVPLDAILFGDAPITAEEFSKWHRQAVEALSDSSSIGIGWAAKLVNLLLKVRAYIGTEGRPGLREHLHPPIDNKLVEAIRNRYPIDGSQRAQNFELRRRVDLGSPISSVRSYEEYLYVIEGLREVARREGCGLCEVEQLWPG